MGNKMLASRREKKNVFQKLCVEMVTNQEQKRQATNGRKEFGFEFTHITHGITELNWVSDLKTFHFKTIYRQQHLDCLLKVSEIPTYRA
jgi:hypothetical protein